MEDNVSFIISRYRIMIIEAYRVWQMTDKEISLKTINSSFFQVVQIRISATFSKGKSLTKEVFQEVEVFKGS